MDSLIAQLSASSPIGLNVSSVILGILGAFLCGQLLGWAYEYTFRGLSYSRGFTQTLILAPIAAVVLVQSMGQSWIAGIGLFGILSMIRFRNTLKSPRDLIFLMASVTAGVAVGVEAWPSALIGTVAFGIVAIYLHVGVLGSRRRYDGLLRLRLPTGSDNTTLHPVLSEYCRRFELLSMGELAQGEFVEHTFQIKLWNPGSESKLLQRLRHGLGAQDVRVLVQDATLEY
jgi:hypothetical protein